MTNRSLFDHSERFPFAAVIVAAVLAAGGLYLILQKAAPIAVAPAATPTTPTKAVTPPLVTAPAVRAAEQVEVLPGPAVYRCKVNGTTTYSDAPCPGGKRIDTTPAAQGFAPTPAGRAATVAQSAADEAEPSRAATKNEKAKRDARCAWIEKAIESIDAQARQGQSTVIQDRLREDRQRLVDERYALKC